MVVAFFGFLLILSGAFDVWLTRKLYLARKMSDELRHDCYVLRETSQERWKQIGLLEDARDQLARKLKDANEQVSAIGRDLQIARETITRQQKDVAALHENLQAWFAIRNKISHLLSNDGLRDFFTESFSKHSEAESTHS